MSQADGSIIIDTRIDQAGLSKGLSTMKGAVVKGVAALTAAIGAASIAVINLGSDFEQANAKASTLFGDAKVNMTQYQGKMLDLSNKTGLAATELGNTMYDALSAGIPASDDMSEAMGFLEKNTKLAKAGFTDINTATTATAKVLNAYKMDVSQTDKIHKVLIQTQNKGITTVNELGSVLSQVTPTAAAMNVSFEQVGASLANMTAQGTPTAQATTQLNQLFSELGKKGTAGQKALEKAAAGSKYAGKSFQELMKEGVPLNDVIDLMGKYADKNNLSMIDMFSSIDAGKAALAVSGKNAEQYTENLKAMKTQTDVVGEAYDKVTDTFKEKSAKVVNSLKNVGIAAYAKFEKPLKKSMDVAQSSVDSLSRDMSSGKLGKSVDKIAKAFGSLIEITAKLASKAIPLLAKGFTLLIDHGKALTIGITAISTAMGAIKLNNKFIEPIASSFIKAKKAVETYNIGLDAASAAGVKFNGTLSLGQAAVGLLTGQLSLATAAQTALNAVQAVSPMGWVAIGVGALTAGIAALAFAIGDTTDENKELTESLEKSNEEWESLKKTQDDKLASDLGMIQNTEKLKDELDSLVDANGRVKKGYEDRASFILGELNKALGTEYSMTDGVISKYKEMTTSIDELITKKRVKAILDAQEPIYQKAITDQQKEGIQIAKLLTDVTDKSNKKKELENQLIATYGATWQDSKGKTLDAVWQEWNALNTSIVDKKKILKDYQNSYSKHTDEIIGYENNMTLAASKNKDDWAKIQTDIQATSGKTYEEKKKNLELEVLATDYAYKDLIERQKAGDTHISDAQIEAAKKSKENKEKELRGILSAVEDGTPGITNASKNLANQSTEALDKQKDSKKKGTDNASSYTKGVSLKNKDAETAGKELASYSVTGLNNYKDMSLLGKNSAQGYIDGLASMASDAFNAGFAFIKSALIGGKKAQDSHSPSRKWRKEVGQMSGAGYIKGVEDMTGEAEKATSTFIGRAISAANNEASKGINMSEAINRIKSAIFAEQAKMGLVVNAQAKEEIMRTSIINSQKESLETSSGEPTIINRIYLDSTQLAEVITPKVSNKFALSFSGRR